MKISNLKKGLSFLFSSLLFSSLMLTTSCEKDSGVTPPKEETTAEVGMMKLGEKLENPYSVKNMRKALRDLQSEGMLKSASTADTVIPTTHLYVRFLPQDTAQMNILLADSTLELFGYPLDYDIAEEGSYYHDPSIPEGQITWQYTTVKPDYQFPNVKYEILEECYIPDDSTNLATSQAQSLLKSQLETRALQNAGFIANDSKSSSGVVLKGFLSGEKPDGYIKVEDTSLPQVNGANQFVPVKGVKVRCHIVVKWATDFTDENGYYKMSSKFPVGPHYALVFDNCKDFTIWNNWGPFAAANYGMGWHSKGGHDESIPSSSTAWDLCTVNNAGYDHYNWCVANQIKTPPTDLRIWVTKMFGCSAPMLRRVVYEHLGWSGKSGWDNFFINASCADAANAANIIAKSFDAEPDITINPNFENPKTTLLNPDKPNSFEIYVNTRHELSHASHFSKVGSEYWAKYINYIITYGSYGNGSGYNSGYCGVGEMWAYFAGYSVAADYYKNSPDIYWDANNYWFMPNILRRLKDRNYFTYKQIYDCLDARSINSLKTRLIDFNNGKKADIDAAFAYYGF